VTELMTALSDIEIPSGPGRGNRSPPARQPADAAADPARVAVFARANRKIWDEIEADRPVPWTQTMAAAARAWGQHREYLSALPAIASASPVPFTRHTSMLAQGGKAAPPHSDGRYTSSRGVSRGRSVNGSLRSMIRPAGENDVRTPVPFRPVLTRSRRSCCIPIDQARFDSEAAYRVRSRPGWLPRSLPVAGSSLARPT
jgi:hypothetical protein